MRVSSSSVSVFICMHLWLNNEVLPNLPPRRLAPRSRTPRRRPWLPRPHLLRKRIRGSRPEHPLAPVQPDPHQKPRPPSRGAHRAPDPNPEIKLIRCSAGAIYDVLVDVRRDSSTFGK